MAISNAIGSNVFDILVCLGVPWLFKTMNGDYITVKSKGDFTKNDINSVLILNKLFSFDLFCYLIFKRSNLFDDHLIRHCNNLASLIARQQVAAG